MAIPPKQTGWTQKANLLWDISRQLDKTLSLMCTGACPTTTTTTTSIAPEACTETPVVIGTQTWTKCNLNVTTYRNGDAIVFVDNETDWNNYAAANIGAWCYYDYNPANGLVYGKLYNRPAVNDPRGLAPVGQHIPTITEFNTLISFLGTDPGGKMKQAGTSLWLSPNTGATNSSGFTGLPGGANFTGTFSELHTTGFWWSSTALPTVNNVMYLSYNDTVAAISATFNDAGNSVRCLID